MTHTVMGNMLALDNEIDVDVYARGEDGRGIISNNIQYATNSSSSEHPTSGWSDTIPVVAQGDYLWEKITYTYIDDTTFESYLSIYQAKDGVSVVNVVPKYQQGDSGTVEPTGYWSPTFINVDPGKFLWIKATITYSDDSTSTISYPTYMGDNGAIFIPAVDSNGNISWTNDKGLPNPETKNIRGPKGEKGDPGVTPVANVNKVGAVATITITDAVGTTTAQISDGNGDMSKSEFVYAGGTGQVLNSKSVDGVELNNSATTNALWTCDKIKTNTSNQIINEGVTTYSGSAAPASSLGKNGDIYILTD